MAMAYRDLGKTGLKVSAIGLGCGSLGATPVEYASRLVQRAVELGITYFDTARGYSDSEIKLGLGVKGQRDEVILSTKTNAKTRDDAWREINESLERMGTDYVDNWHLHGLFDSADVETRTGPGGALEALIEAKRQGLTRHIGCTAHRSAVLLEAIKRFDFEIILVPMNIIEREPLDELIPLCRQKGIGVTIMKPVATGLLAAPLALKWLLNQPIACTVPGATTLEELEMDALVGRQDWTLSAEEQARCELLRQEWEHTRCRICNLCLPCPKDIAIGFTLGTDVMYDYYRNRGRDGFRTLNWGRLALERDLVQRENRIEAIESCDRCGECEKRCPYGLPIVDMLQSMLPAMKDLMQMERDLLAAM